MARKQRGLIVETPAEARQAEPGRVIAPARFILHRTRMDATTSSPAVNPVCPARNIRHSSAIRIEKTARPQPAG